MYLEYSHDTPALLVVENGKNKSSIHKSSEDPPTDPLITQILEDQFTHCPIHQHTIVHPIAKPTVKHIDCSQRQTTEHSCRKPFTPIRITNINTRSTSTQSAKTIDRTQLPQTIHTHQDH